MICANPSGSRPGGFGGPPKADHYAAIDDIVIWRTELAGIEHGLGPATSPHPNPLVINDLVVASTFNPGLVVACSQSEGRERWRVELDYLGHSASVAHGSRILAGTSRTLYSIDAQTGRAKWRWTPYGETGEWVYSLPVIDCDRIYLGDRAGRLHCLEVSSGDCLWWQQTSDAENNDVNATAIVVDEVVITATNAAVVIAYEKLNGTEVWRQQIDGPCCSAVLRFGDLIVVNSSQSLYLLNPMNGRIVRTWQWESEQIDPVVAITPNRIVIATRSRDTSRSPEMRLAPGTMHCVDAESAHWTAEAHFGFTAFRFESSIDRVLEARSDGLGFIDPSTGRRTHWIGKWHGARYLGSWRPALPAVANGRLFALAQELRVTTDGTRPPTVARPTAIYALRLAV